MAIEGRGGFLPGCHLQIFELLVHQEPRPGLGHISDHPDGRGVGAVSRAERVIHINFAERRKLLGKCGVIFLFFGVKAQVFEQQHLTGRRQHALDRGPGAIRRQRDGAGE
jgi:hypothetical protein